MTTDCCFRGHLDREYEQLQGGKKETDYAGLAPLSRAFAEQGRLITGRVAPGGFLTINEVYPARGFAT